MTLRIHAAFLPALFLAASCAEPEPGESAETQAASSPLTVAAPAVLLPAAADAGLRPVLMIADADVAGMPPGRLVLFGDEIQMEAGFIEAPWADFDVASRTVLLIPGEPTGFVDERGEAVPVDEVSAHIEAKVSGYQRAYLETDDGRITLTGPLEVIADTLAWNAADSRILLLDEESQGSGGPGSAGGPSGFPGLFGAASREATVDAVEGESCMATSECTDGTACVEDPMNSDGTPRCFSICVQPPEFETRGVTCVDDEGCCDLDAACSDDGLCILPGSGSGGGSGGTTQGGTGCNSGCGDADNDGVCNSLDRKPEESCTADADNDGCKDSCDADDANSSDSCGGGGSDDSGGIFCRARSGPRLNSTFASLMFLLLARGRARRRSPQVG